jgi:nucleotide-binding universal stress UspA family protein
MYDTILVPTDGSDVAEHAVDHAVDLAEKYGADIHALYVVDTSAVDVSLGTEQVDRIQQGHFGDMPELERRANEATSAVAAKAAEHGIDVTEAVVAGQPHRQIANYATNHGVDLIVMGSAGRSGVRRVLLGSVAERTLRSTKLPVLVVDLERE